MNTCRFDAVRLHKHIVIGQDTGNALGTIRSLGEEGIKPSLIGPIDLKNAAIIRSKYIGDVHVAPTRKDVVPVLLQHYGKEQLKPFVYVNQDMYESELDEHYEELKDKFYFFNSGQNGVVNELMNKNTICEIAKSCGCRIPQKEVVEKGQLPTTLHYPVITKALKSMIGAWKRDVFVCENEGDLKEAYEQIESPKLLLQEYILKKNELAIMGFSINGGEQVCLPYQLSYYRSSDSAYGHYMYFKPCVDERLREQIQNIIKKCNFSGCFEVEFLIDSNNQLIFLEVNFRYSFWNYALTFGGVNYPLEWAKATLENNIEDQLAAPDTSNPLFKEFFSAMDGIGDFVQNVQHGNVSFVKWILDVFHADMCYYYNSKDVRPVIQYLINKVFHRIKHRKRQDDC